MSRLIIVDVSSFIFRAYYAIRQPLTTPEGVLVNACYGVANMLTKIVTQYDPTHILIARDTKGGSFRNELYDQYKANRDAPPEDLIPQFALIQEMVEKMHFPSIQIENYEADDIIGSAAVQFQDKFDEVFIASGDKDLMQFVNEKVKMLDTMKDKIYGPDEVFEKMGVRPDQIVDYLSLLGDSSDNIPGVKGIGAKGAAKLLAEYGTLEECISNVDDIKNKRVKTGLTEHVDNAYLSKKLIQIVTDLDLDADVKSLEFQMKVDDTLVDFLKGLGFNTTIKKLQAVAKGRGGDTSSANKKKEKQASKTIKKLNKDILSSKEISLYFKWNFRDDFDQKISQFGLANDSGVWLVEGEGLLEEFIEKFSGTLVAHDSKEVYNYCFHNELETKFSAFDLSIAHFLINPSVKHTIAFMVEEYLGDVVDEDDDEGLLSSLLFSLYAPLKEKIEGLELQDINDNVELPLVPILSKMQVEGVNLNSYFYSELEERFSKELNNIKDEIDSYTEDEVNLKSPKQVSKLLFEDLDLPIIKKTKTGASTDAEVLNTLAQMDAHPVPALLLKYRELDKLLSTYIKALPKLINEKTGKLHTTFQQTNAATGRLSSDHPNLQNIPVRTENGRLLRKGFFARPGHLLLAADYSQVELRILAHLSNDPIMLEAFKNDKDIHQQTAAEIFDEDLSVVTREQRSSAKAINFGLMYGQSSFGLSKQLGITRKEAKEYITYYFERFSKVKTFLDSLKEICEEKGYAETLFGRKRFLPDINSSNRTVKAMAERVAINSPIQGTAADIIKMAMIKVDHRLKDEGLESKMILQVHDELIFEVPEAEIDTMTKLVIEEMEGAVKLSIPLKVDYGVGENWFDLK